MEPQDLEEREAEQEGTGAEDDTEFDLGWDAGPTYRIGRRAPAWSEADPTGLVRDVLVVGRIGGSLSLDGGVLAGDLFDRGDDGLAGRVRRARINTRGELHYGRPTEYKFEFAFEGRKFFLNDFYLRWRFSRWIDSIKFGYFDPPVSFEALAGTADRSLMEMPPALSAFAPGFRLGIEVAGSHEVPSLAWAANVSSVGQTPQDGDASSSPLRLTGRLVWRPWIDEEAAEPEVLHLGASLRYQISKSGTIRYRARPESFLADYAVDTGDIEGGFGTLGLEALWRRGPLAVQAEAFQVAIDAEEEGSLLFWGLYGQATWAVTGEAKPYDAARGLLGRTVPRAPLSPREGRWGALELTGRVAWIDLRDGGVRGGRMLTLHVGPAWTWNRFARVLAGYVFAHTSGRADAGDAHIAQLRLELVL